MNAEEHVECVYVKRVVASSRKYVELKRTELGVAASLLGKRSNPFMERNMKQVLHSFRQKTDEELFSEQKRMEKLPFKSKRGYPIYAGIVALLIANELNERLWQKRYWG